MYKTVTVVACLILITFPASSGGQLLLGPESVAFDSLNNRYLVSNWESGDLVQIDSNGVQDYFKINQACYAGLHIVGSNVYVAGKNEGIRGFDLATGDEVMNLLIPGTSLLNDITSDTSGNLYVTDPQTHQIIRIRLSDHRFFTFVNSGISNPNGILFDEINNRLLLVSSRNYSPIQAISLEDSSVTTIVNTGLHILDGLTEDNEGYYYCSSWGSNSVYRYDTTFTNPPEFVSSHLNSPADIFYNKIDNILAVPVFYYNRVEFVQVYPTSVADNNADVSFPELINLSRNYPNPFNSSTEIQYSIPFISQVRIDIFDILGRKVETLVNREELAGTHRITWSASDYPSGIYFYRIRSNNFVETRRMTLMQ